MVVFCVVRSVHEFDFRLVINETSKKWRPVFVKILRHVVMETRVFDTMYTFSPDRRRECEGTLPTLCK